MADQIPDLWWSPTAGVVQKLDGGWRGYGGGSEKWWGFNTAEPFPADAVQLTTVDLCPIECACGPRAVPWPREATVVECETCGQKHAIGPLMDNYRSAMEHVNFLLDKNRELRDRIRELEDDQDADLRADRHAEITEAEASEAQQPRGEAAYRLEGDDEIFTEADRG